MAKPFPETPFLAGFERPCRFEGTVFDLPVHGKIPEQIKGTFYRVMPDPLLSPAYYKNGEHFVPFDGDGNVSAFRIANGHVDMQQAYVQTERLKAEKAKRASLWGRYRNPFTCHPCVQASLESTANTNIFYFNGKLLALKENGLPYAMNPHTLETIGYDDFNGQIKSKTFTAHPKLDPDTKELVSWGYEAKGLATPDVCYFTLAADGKMTEELWFQTPFVGFMHDAVITKDYVVFELPPMITNMERLKAGETHWVYDYAKEPHFVVVPRRGGSPSSIRWFKWQNCLPMHSANAYQTTGPNGEQIIVCDTVLVRGNGIPFFPEQNLPEVVPSKNVKIQLVRWTLDMSKALDSTPVHIEPPKVIWDNVCEFPKIDERFMGKKYKYVFLPAQIPDNEDEAQYLVGGGGLNVLAMVNTDTGDVKICKMGPNRLVQEPVFIPRYKDSPEGDGFVMALVNRLKDMYSDLVIVDTKDFSKPCAVVELPFRLRFGLHGNWVDDEDLVQN